MPHTWCCQLLRLCGRVACSVVLSACCLRSAICDLRKKNVTRGKIASQNLTYVRRDRGCETRGFALNTPKAKKGKNACYTRHNARIAPKPRAMWLQGPNCAPPSLAFRIKVLAQRYTSEHRGKIYSSYIHARCPSETWFPGGKSEWGERKSPLNICFVSLTIAVPKGGIVLWTWMV